LKGLPQSCTGQAQIQNAQLPEEVGFHPQRAAGEQRQPEQNPMQELAKHLAQVSIEEERVQGMEESCTSISFHLFILLDMGDVASDSD
jgi:hypothetical protein